MDIIDMHSHWGTERGYVLRSAEALAQQKNTWNSTARYESEDEMVAYFQANRVRAVLDFGFTKTMPLDEVIPLHDYALEMQAAHPDAILGNWLQIDPRLGERGARELERCIQSSKGFVGYCVSASGMGFPADDPHYGPYYEVLRAHARPALILVGHTGSGAGLPGGGGIRLELCHPRYIDSVAVDWPDLTIISGRPAWPWQDEMISIMLHKPNVFAELHGWSPKYLTDPLKREIRSRLRRKVMFGGDYPLFRYERLVDDWKALGYADDVLGDVFSGNAARLLGLPEGGA
jgi:predicted TIM-barrel fold metal-dependent hydrolase